VSQGKVDQGLTELAHLREKMDGCGTSADNTDWIVDCTAHVQIRARRDLLVANLSACPSIAGRGGACGPRSARLSSWPRSRRSWRAVGRRVPRSRPPMHRRGAASSPRSPQRPGCPLDQRRSGPSAGRICRSRRSPWTRRWPRKAATPSARCWMTLMSHPTTSS
jgi:hypothetical protein